MKGGREGGVVKVVVAGLYGLKKPFWGEGEGGGVAQLMVWRSWQCLVACSFTYVRSTSGKA